MKTTRIIAVAALTAATGLAFHGAQAQKWDPGASISAARPSVGGREVIQVIVELEPGTTAPRHSHPGEEIIYVLEGTWEYTLEGKPPVIVKAGEVLFIPAGTIHSARNVGAGRGPRARDVYRRKGQAAPRAGEVSVNVTYDRERTALLVIDPYNDFISEGGKVWDRLKGVAEANGCVPHMLEALNAARKAGLRVFYALHRRYRAGDYESWNTIAPIQKAAWSRKVFEHGTWAEKSARSSHRRRATSWPRSTGAPAASPTPT